MRQGYVPVGLCAPELVLGDPRQNAQLHIRMIMAAIKHGTKVLVFPELSITGASLGSLFLNKRLMETVEDSIVSVVETTAGSDIIVVFGAPVYVEGNLYDCAVVAGNGHIHGVVPKTNIKGLGHEQVFSTAPEKNSECIIGGMKVPFGTKLIFQSLQLPELRIAVELGEDMNCVVPPSAMHALAGATVIAAPTATENHAGGGTVIGTWLRAHSSRCACAYLRCDAGIDESVSGGMCLAHMAVIENGESIKEEIHVKKTIVASEVDVQLLASERERRSEFKNGRAEGYEYIYFNSNPTVTNLTRTVDQGPFLWSEASRVDWAETILQMQVDAIVRRVESTQAAAIVVMMDGGVATSVAAYNAARAAKALGRGPDNVICVTCKGPGMTQACVNRAMTLAETLMATSAVLDISEDYKRRVEILGVNEKEDPEGAREIAMRLRRSVVMDLANQVGGIVLNTDDMSDWAVGSVKSPSDPDTFAVNAGIPKTAMRYLLINIQEKEDEFRQLSNVLRAVLVEDGGKVNPGRGQVIRPTEQVRITDMQVNDFCMYYLVRYGFSPNKVLRLADTAMKGGIGEVTLYKYVSDFFRNYMANRVLHTAIPDGPRYLPVDLRMDKINGDFYEDLWEEELEAMKPEGVEDIEQAAALEISERDDMENREREEEQRRMEPTEEMRLEMQIAHERAMEQIAKEREREQRKGDSKVGLRMEGYERSPEEFQRELEQQRIAQLRMEQLQQNDPKAFFEAMRLQAEAQIAKEREEEMNK